MSLKEISAPQSKSKLDLANILFLTISPLIGIVGTGVYVYFNGIHWLEIVLFALYYVATGLSITAGYHRFFAHRSYDCHPALKFFYLVFGACALQNSMIRWASDHRMHHKHVDTDLDPYNIKRGGFFAHMGWIFYKSTDKHLDNMKDFSEDPMVVWQEKYYVPIAISVGFILPALLGLTVGRPWGALLWGGFFRVVFVHHMTFFINSLAHMVGTQTYTDGDSSRDSWWLAFLTYGEGYHNFHHKFQADYRNGVKWYHWDPSKWLIRLAYHCGFASRLNRTPTPSILKAKMAMDLKVVREKVHWMPQEFWQMIHKQMDQHKAKLERAHLRMALAKMKYDEVKARGVDHSRHALSRWNTRMKIYERMFKKQKEGWKQALESALAQARSTKAITSY